MTENAQNAKIILTSSKKALKLRFRVTTFLVFVLAAALFVSTYYGIMGSYNKYSDNMARFNTELGELEKRAAEYESCKAGLSEKNALYFEWQDEIDTAKIAGNFKLYEELLLKKPQYFDCLPYNSYFHTLLIRDKPELFDTSIGWYIFCDLLLLVIICSVFYCLRAAIRRTDDVMEFDSETGEFYCLQNDTFSRNDEFRYVLDSISAIKVHRWAYCKEQNVGSITIFGQYIVADEVYDVKKTLPYCGDLSESIAQVQKFMRKRGMDAVKVKIIDK